MGRLELARATPGAVQSTADRWPVWAGPVGFAIAIAATVALAAVVGALALIAGADAPADSPAVALLATLLQDAALIATAVAFGARYGPIRLSDFGLRPVALKVAVPATALAALAFYALSGAYSALVRPDAEQEIVERLGTERGPGYLLATAVLVILVAPLAEELFFRGFFYRSLRNRLPPLAAALIVGLVFGAIHYTDAQVLLLLPVLALLGVVFCLLYERTGSLYPAIALHAINNGLALAVSADTDGAVAVSAALTSVALAACMLVPRLTGRKSG